jgi:hypothetical protein
MNPGPQFLVICSNKVLKRDHTRRPSPQNIYNIPSTIFINILISHNSFGIIPLFVTICKTLRALRALRAWVRDTNVEASPQL